LHPQGGEFEDLFYHFGGAQVVQKACHLNPASESHFYRGWHASRPGSGAARWIMLEEWRILG
jgi:hypothetical protein